MSSTGDALQYVPARVAPSPSPPSVSDKESLSPLQNIVHAHEPEEVLASDLVVLAADVDAIYDRAIALTLEETTEILEDAWREHHDDPSESSGPEETCGSSAADPIARADFPTAVKDKIEYFLSGDSSTLENYDLLLEEMKIESGLIRFSSPYPEVRSVVKSTDDYNEVASTFRAWVIGTIWCGLGSFINRASLPTLAFVEASAELSSLLACRVLLAPTAVLHPLHQRGPAPLLPPG